MELMQASRQWSTRPADERFVDLYAMQDHFHHLRDNSREVTVSSRRIEVQPDGTQGILITGPNGHAYAPTHWAFGQLAARAGAPAGYLRSLPAPIAADCLNYGFKFDRDVEEIGVLLHRDSTDVSIRAATGPRYGRIWNADVVDALANRFGDGVTGDWRVPGEFGRAVTVTKDNTTLFAGDRDMFIFLADEQHRIEVPNRRNGEAGSMARGFFVWNSEVGASTFGLATFLFDYVCCNRIVWGASDYKEIKLRHTAGAPDRFIQELRPALNSYANSSATGLLTAIANAKADRISGKDGELDAFLAQRFGRAAVAPIKKAHEIEEQRPIETRWDVVTGATAWAKGLEWQDDRVAIERKAGELLTA